MLKQLLTVSLLIAGTTAQISAQGLINFNTQTLGTISKVRDMSGTFATGNGYFAALYYAVGSGRPADSLELIPNQPPRSFQGGGNIGWVRATPTNALGQAVNATVGIPAVTAAGTTVTLQMRAWSAPFTSFEAAQAGGGQYGSSGTFNVLAGGNFPPDPATPPANLVGLVGFQLIPEPSVIGLGILGAGALLFLRRRK